MLATINYCGSHKLQACRKQKYAATHQYRIILFYITFVNYFSKDTQIFDVLQETLQLFDTKKFKANLTRPLRPNPGNSYFFIFKSNSYSNNWAIFKPAYPLPHGVAVTCAKQTGSAEFGAMIPQTGPSQAAHFSRPAPVFCKSPRFFFGGRVDCHQPLLPVRRAGIVYEIALLMV